jgi:para-nitrobenzyl esterase
VLVTLDYRLSTFGFFPSTDVNTEQNTLGLPPFTGNQGFQDQQMALRWVQTNIAAFGGNPNNVTLFGQSVGGGFMCQHLISPQSQGLFKGVISESPVSCDTNPAPDSLMVQSNLTSTYASLLGCTQATAPARLACLRSVPASLFLAINNITGSDFAWSILLNGYDFPNSTTAFSTGAFSRVPVMMGTNRDEYALLYELYDPPLLNYSDPTAYYGFVNTYSYDSAALIAAANLSNFNNNILNASIPFQTLRNFTCAAGRTAGYLA